MQCLILAGGFATRLWPLTERRAKPLLPLAGTPILTYILKQVPTDLPVTVSTNAVFADDFKKWKKTVARKNVEILIEDAGHEDQKLGALGAVALWLRKKNIDDDVLLIAGDNYAEINMEAFLALRRGRPLLAAHDLGDLEAAKRFGTILVEEGDGPAALKNVTSFEEKPEHPKSTFVSTGLWFLPRAFLTTLQEYAVDHPDNVGGVFEEFIRRKVPVDCFIFSEIWKDIGSFESYLSLHQEVVDGRIITHPTAEIGRKVELQGSVDIGPETRIEESSLTDCILFGDTVIRDCVLKRCIIDEGCTLEGVDLSDKMLRRGTVLRRRMT